MFDWFTFSVYLRVFIEVFQRVIQVSFSEISEYDFENNRKLASICITVGILILFLIIIVIAFINWIRLFSRNKSYKHIAFRELFIGYKNNSKSRFVVLIFFVKRILLVIF